MVRGEITRVDSRSKKRIDILMTTLRKRDYEFIEEFCIKHRLSSGKGYRLLLEIFLQEYKTSLPFHDSIPS